MFNELTDPSDWRNPDMCSFETLLRCPICQEFLDSALLLPKCGHSYCSLCIRRYLESSKKCPTCSAVVAESELINNRVVDQLVHVFKKARPSVLAAVNSAHEQQHGKHSQKVSNEKVRSNAQLPSIPSVSGKAQSSLHTKPHATSQVLETQPTQIQNTTVTTTTTSSSTTTAAVDTQELLAASQSSDIAPSPPLPADAQQGAKTLSIASALAAVPPAPATGSEDSGPCPVCGKIVSARIANEHLDSCLNRQERMNGLRKANVVEVSEIRKKLPKVAFSVMSTKQLKSLCLEYSLSTLGEREAMEWRIKEYVLRYNASCDSLQPKPLEEIRKAIDKAEKARMSVKNSKKEDAGKTNEEIVKANSSSFKKLAEQARQRDPRKKSQASAAPATLTSSTTQPENILVLSDNDDDDFVDPPSQNSNSGRGSRKRVLAKSPERSSPRRLKQ